MNSFFALSTPPLSNSETPETSLLRNKWGGISQDDAESKTTSSARSVATKIPRGKAPQR